MTRGNYDDSAVTVPESNTDMLQHLAHVLQCCFISDLHFCKDREKLAEVVDTLDIDNYSIFQWNDAATYLTAKPCDFVDSNEAKNHILTYLRG